MELKNLIPQANQQEKRNRPYSPANNLSAYCHLEFQLYMHVPLRIMSK